MTSEDLGKLDYQVMAIAFGIHDDFGCHWDESIYQVEMHNRILDTFSSSEREVPLTVSFGTFSKTYRLDLVVDEIGIYELKTVAAIEKAHIGQVLNYLRLLNATRAKIINFRTNKVESRFVNCSDTLSQRRSFDIATENYRGPKELSEVAIRMLQDLGTKLSNELYTECLVSNIGRSARRRVWADRNVYQRFNFVAENEAFVVTALDTGQANYRTHLKRMRQTARLTHLHWINVTPDVVRFESAE
ncbi:GxxExxY protein [Rhodopirellula bahusiensis]|uniref:GxxExxY protein n=1 Tax=Rhodopirellula bahusiensis TaxID=2014065 RepID=UPI003263A901